eukprot:TRINITY_DN38225_c0_g2_i1.p1 TRINITY_DN38225_c0_g2~~TRINITY_DN38225_c0_g2_i1.p1  ORF type:complete len:263 (-),score=30.43 TRINITY_DN38225_c0_g2_i1:126-914(-)
MPNFRAPQPHAFCPACQLVLPSKAFSEAQIRESSDDLRRCRRCVSKLQCSQCRSFVPCTDFSLTQQRKPSEIRRCSFCLRGDSPEIEVGHGGYHRSENLNMPIGFATATSTSRQSRHSDCGDNGADLYWKWLLNVNCLLGPLPSEVLPPIFGFLCSAPGVVELGGRLTCAVCNKTWPRDLRSTVSFTDHWRSPVHLRSLVGLKAAARPQQRAAQATEQLSTSGTSKKDGKNKGSSSNSNHDMSPGSCGIAEKPQRRWGRRSL